MQTRPLAESSAQPLVSDGEKQMNRGHVSLRLMRAKKGISSI